MLPPGRIETGTYDFKSDTLLSQYGINHDNHPSSLYILQEKIQSENWKYGQQSRQYSTRVHLYEEINLGEMAPVYEDVDVVSDQNPSPGVPRTDLDADGYLNLEGQQDDKHAYQRPASGNDDEPLFEDQRHDTEAYLKPVPSNHDVIESKYLTPPLPGATASPYSTPYDHVSSWQKSLQSKLKRPW